MKFTVLNEYDNIEINIETSKILYFQLTLATTKQQNQYPILLKYCVKYVVQDYEIQNCYNIKINITLKIKNTLFSNSN